MSLHRALAADLGMIDFDPLDCDMAMEWMVPTPDWFSGKGDWRSMGDAVEGLELLAADLVSGARAPRERQAAARRDGGRAVSPRAQRLARAGEEDGAHDSRGVLVREARLAQPINDASGGRELADREPGEELWLEHE